jgi:hypothetical protein
MNVNIFCHAVNVSKCKMINVVSSCISIQIKNEIKLTSFQIHSIQFYLFISNELRQISIYCTFMPK